MVVHAFGDNGANVYQFLHEELRHLGIETRLKAVVFENGPSESFLISRRARDGGQEQLISNSGRLDWFLPKEIRKLSRDGGQEQLISNDGRFKPVFAQRDRKQRRSLKDD